MKFILQRSSILLDCYSPPSFCDTWAFSVVWNWKGALFHCFGRLSPLLSTIPLSFHVLPSLPKAPILHKAVGRSVFLLHNWRHSTYFLVICACIYTLVHDHSHKNYTGETLLKTKLCELGPVPIIYSDSIFLICRMKNYFYAPYTP